MSDKPANRPHAAWHGETAAILYVGLLALGAQFSGVATLLFPEIGALSHDILKRPYGIWAMAPLRLIATPFLTGCIGTLTTRSMPYGFASVLLTVGSAMLVIRALRSPIAPAMSAGLLPLTLGVQSWWYPPSLLVGLVPLAALSVLLRRIISPPATPRPAADVADDIVELPPADYALAPLGWAPWFLAFLLLALLLVHATGWRFLLAPPLVVIGAEMFAHPATCPWASRPLAMPVACALSAACGLLLVQWLGAGMPAAMASMAIGTLILRAARLHVPPLLAIGLLPGVMEHPGPDFPLAVAMGAALLTACFTAWRIAARHGASSILL